MSTPQAGKVLRGAIVALACALFFSAHARDPMPPLPHIVLVHGAFADGSSWLPVIALLQRRGYHVTAVQNRLISLDDDVQATLKVIARQDSEVLLVGHSWGGAVITQAGNDARVRGLVYLAALAPDSGESVAELLARMQAPMTGLQADAQGLIWLDDPAAYARVMAADLAPSTARRLAAVQQPIAARAFGDKVGHAAWRDKPSWYLVTYGDQALPAEVQQRLSARIQAHQTVITSSHLSMQSQPQAVAALIEQAAASVRRR